MTAGPVLRAHNLFLQRGSRPIYTDFFLDLDIGVTAVLGPNGIGKTTLLEALADPTTITRGELTLNGNRASGHRALSHYFARTGFLPQKWSSYRGFTVRDTVGYVAWLKGLGGKAATMAVRQVLSDLDLAHLARERVHRLSGGVQQRVGIAEAFVHTPDAVFLDEPTVGLDPEQRNVVRRYLRDQADTRAVVVSTHLTDDVEAIADRVIVVSGGCAIFDGTPKALARAGAPGTAAASAIEAGYLEVVRRSGAEAK